MSKNKNLETRLRKRQKELADKELALFGAYNRHADPKYKKRILDELKDVIIRREELTVLTDE